MTNAYNELHVDQYCRPDAYTQCWISFGPASLDQHQPNIGSMALFAGRAATYEEYPYPPDRYTGILGVDMQVTTLLLKGKT